MLQDVPTVLGERYRVVERLGRGGMADVYRAEDVVLRRPVAIKIFRGGLEREQHLARFRAEVRTLAGLTHPHLVALYDAGGDISEPWCAMEYVDGGSLADREEALPPDHVARIGEQIAAGLVYVHARGIVHRDVKPSNVLLDARGDAFLSDFGIAKLVDGTRMTQSGLMIGTAAFLSPEQVRGRNAGPASDVYALGLVLLEALTGSREYPGTPVESAVARLSRAPRVPSSLAPDWGDLIGSMTAEDPDHRPTPQQVVLRLRGLARRLTGAARYVRAADPGPDEAELDGQAGQSDAVQAEQRAPAAPGEGEPDLDRELAELTELAEPTELTDARAGSARPQDSTPVVVPVITQAVDGPRNLLGWLSQQRRRRGEALLAAAGVVVAVAVALPLVDGRRAGDSAVRVDTTVTQPTGTVDGAPPVTGDGNFQVRKAPVEVPTSEPDRNAGAVDRPVYRVPRVAGTATAPPLPSPTTRPPSPTASPSPSSSSTASPSASSGSASPPTSGATPSDSTGASSSGTVGSSPGTGSGSPGTTSGSGSSPAASFGAGPETGFGSDAVSFSTTGVAEGF